MFLTAQLVLVVFMLAVEKHKSTFLAPVGIGLTLFVTQIVGVYYTGGSLNPARSFGPDVVLGSFPGYHWIYCSRLPSPLRADRVGVGPGLGAILSTGLYIMMKVLDYDKVNGTQDRDDTILVAHIMPRPESSGSGSASSAVATVVENGGRGDYFDSKDIVVSEVKPGSGPMSPVEGPTNPV
jgi:aquaporin related protein